VPSALVLLIVLCLTAASNCRHIANTKSRINIFHYRKEKLKASCFSVPDKSENTVLHFNNLSKGHGDTFKMNL
jgi:hypothetical protein